MILSGKSVPGEGSGIGWKGFKKLFIDRLRGERVVVLAANRRGFMRWFGGIVDINIALIRYFLRMNEKDVLGARPASGNVQKMESVPHWAKSRFCAKSGFYFSVQKCLFLVISEATFQAGNYSYFSSMFIVLIFTGDWIVRYQNDIKYCTGNIKWSKNTLHLFRSAYIVIILLFHIAHAHAPIRDSNRYTKIHLLHTQHFTV